MATALKYKIILLLFILLAVSAWAQPAATGKAALADRWADSVLATLSLKEQAAQLMVVRVPRNMTKKQQREFDHLIAHHDIGGICFFAGNSADQLRQTRRYQGLAQVPLLVCIDGEWGLGMRLTDCYSFPRQMLMGALPPEHDSLVYLMGTEVARQCHAMGIHVDFAPVVDLNSNPQNPVIGTRSFGEDKQRVARKAVLYANALRNGGIIATAKHFPGHGDTHTDSHLDLPVIDHSKAYIDSVDLYPFRKLISCGVAGVMVAHLRINAYDTLFPSSLSPAICDTLLRRRLGYKGLVFTDGLDMRAITAGYKNGEAELQALRAGCDILLLPPDPREAIKTIAHAAQDDDALRAAIAARCRKVLRAKYRYIVNEEKNNRQYCKPDAEQTRRCEQIAYDIALHGITLIENRGGLLPLGRDAKLLRVKATELNTAALTAADTNTTIVVDLCATLTPGKEGLYGVKPDTWDAIARLAQTGRRMVLRIFGSPYVLQGLQRLAPLDSLSNLAVVMAYQDHPQVRQAADTLLYRPLTGLLPVTVAPYPAGYSYKPPRRTLTAAVDYDARLVGADMDVSAFRRIDSIALAGIRQQAYPGCQLLVAKGGQVVYNRCYGRLTYDAASPLVDTATLYDLASLTKVAATTLCVMRLVDAGKIKLDDPLSRYLPYLKHTRHSKITVKQALSHCARLKAFDAYWRQVPLVDSAAADTAAGRLLQVSPSLYVAEGSRSLVLAQIAASQPNKDKGYLYSDLGFILLADMVQQVSGQPLDIFASQQFYQPLGMATTTFQPLSHGFAPRRIAPTEVDEVYRRQPLQGFVHDPNAAAMGGVAGHAGLFSSASDLAKLYLMLLAGGEYDGTRYLSPEVISLFNTRHFAKQGNRRALGFDKPLLSGNSRHCAPQASQSSFGHTGFTGTMLWVDPDNDLLFIFLSNRVYPDAADNRLAKLNIRTQIQEEIYNSIKKEL